MAKSLRSKTVIGARYGYVCANCYRYVVEKILSHRWEKATQEFKFEVKWEGYEKKSDRTWEPEENLQ
jgi:predicted DsbA family dithiol-disulfide isomerase